MNMALSNLTPLVLALLLIFSSFTSLGLLIHLSRSQKKHRYALDDLYHKIKEDIAFSVQHKFIELSQGMTELVELAVEVWRIRARITKAGSDLSEVQKKGLETSIQKLVNYLDRYELEIVDYTGEKYNDGLNLDVLSVEKDPSIEVPFVKETVEPTILCKGQVVRKAKIILVSN